jgi:hypothetical protein
MEDNVATKIPSNILSDSEEHGKDENQKRAISQELKQQSEKTCQVLDRIIENKK